MKDLFSFVPFKMKQNSTSSSFTMSLRTKFKIRRGVYCDLDVEMLPYLKQNCIFCGLLPGLN